MTTFDDMFPEWHDHHFGYATEHDLDVDGEAVPIRTGPDHLLYEVAVLKSSANFGVHFCSDAQEVWVYRTRELLEVFLDYGHREWRVTYVPTSRSRGVPTARGYCVPCRDVLDCGGEWLYMRPDTAAKLNTATKSERGMDSEREFARLANEGYFPPHFFTGPAVKASVDDNKCRGIDYFSGGQPVSVKYDKPGGLRSNNKNLFLQTHGMRQWDADRWYQHTYPDAPPQ